MTKKTIFEFEVSTGENLHFQLNFLGLDLSGRTLQVRISERHSTAHVVTLSAPNVELVGTGTVTVRYPKASMVAWSKIQYQADLFDITGGNDKRILATRFVYDEPGRLVHGVKGAQATIQWGANEAVITAIGGVGPAGPSNVLTMGTIEILDPDAEPEATITGESPQQVLNLKLPRGQPGFADKLGAEAARDQALAHANAAEVSKNSAGSSASAALAQRNAADLARGEAVTAATTATNAANSILGAVDAAEDARDAALGYRNVSLTYKNDTEAFRNEAEAFKTAAAASAAAAAQAAANFDPTTWYTRAQSDTLLAGKASVAGGSFTGAIHAPSLVSEGAFPYFSFRSPDAPSGLRNADWILYDGITRFRVVNDAYTTVIRTPISIDHGSGVVALEARPTFAGQTPWDNGNLPTTTHGRSLVNAADAKASRALIGGQRNYSGAIYIGSNNTTLSSTESGLFYQMNLSAGVLVANLPATAGIQDGHSVVVMATGSPSGYQTSRVTSPDKTITYRGWTHANFFLIGRGEVFRFTWLAGLNLWVAECLAQPARVMMTRNHGGSGVWNGATGAWNTFFFTADYNDAGLFQSVGYAKTVPVSGVYHCWYSAQFTAQLYGASGTVYVSAAAPTDNTVATWLSLRDRMLYVNEDYGRMDVDWVIAMNPGEYLNAYYNAPGNIGHYWDGNQCCVTLLSR